MRAVVVGRTRGVLACFGRFLGRVGALARLQTGFRLEGDGGDGEVPETLASSGSSVDLQAKLWHDQASRLRHGSVGKQQQQQQQQASS